MTTTGSADRSDELTALREQLLAAHADLGRTAAGSQHHRRGLSAVIRATDALLDEQERQLAAGVARLRRHAVAVLRLVGGSVAAAMIVVLILATVGVLSGWWWLLALPVLLGAAAVLALVEPWLGPQFTLGLTMLVLSAALVLASVFRLLPLAVLIPLSVISLVVSVGLLMAVGSEGGDGKASE